LQNPPQNKTDANERNRRDEREREKEREGEVAFAE
jgi:hypothetical protein